MGLPAVCSWKIDACCQALNHCCCQGCCQCLLYDCYEHCSGHQLHLPQQIRPPAQEAHPLPAWIFMAVAGLVTAHLPLLLYAKVAAGAISRERLRSLGLGAWL